MSGELTSPAPLLATHPLETKVGAMSALALFFVLGLLTGCLGTVLMDISSFKEVLSSFDEHVITTMCHSDDFAKRSAEAEGWRHEGSLPGRASTLVLGHEVTRARPEGHAQVVRF